MIASTPLPDALRAALDGYTHAPVLDGEAGAEVFRLAATGRPPLYLKCGAGRVADDVTAEAARLVWLAGRLPVPEVRQFVRVPDRAFLLSTALPGRTAYDCLVAQPERLAEIVGAVARFLRTLHALPLADCPFHAGHAFRLADARRNVAAGLVPVPDDADAGWSPAPVLARAEAMLPLGFERVVTHGDFSLGNVLVEDGRVTGCIDVGRLGARTSPSCGRTWVSSAPGRSTRSSRRTASRHPTNGGSSSICVWTSSFESPGVAHGAGASRSRLT